MMMMMTIMMMMMMMLQVHLDTIAKMHIANLQSKL
jgi:hypothetical protein